MGHYDSCREADAKARAKYEKQIAKEQLKLMDKLERHLHQGPGITGISQRHLDAFEDMMNETKLRAK